MLAERGFGNERVEAAHQQTADDTQDDAARTDLGASFAPSVRKGVDDDGHRYKRDSAKEKERVTRRLNNIAEYDADDQSEADANRKCDGHSSDVNCCDQQEVRYVEDYSAHDGERQMSTVCPHQVE